MSASHRKVLITVLGRTAKKDGGYRQTPYLLPDGTKTEPAAFVGWEIAKLHHPDSIIVLGTSGSMWDWLADKAGTFDPELIDAVDAKRVTQQQLDQIVLGPTGIILKLISECRTSEEQLSLLSEIEPLIEENDELILDLTHGFRHLPMLLLLAVVYLRSIRSIRISAAYSSFHDEDSQLSYLFDISGLIKLFDWNNALNAFHKDGDPGIFASLLESDGCEGELLRPLCEASYNSRILRPEKAWNSERAVANQIERHKPEGVSGLFSRYLIRHMGTRDGANPVIRLAAMARRQLQLGSFDRATLLGLNAACAGQTLVGEDSSVVHKALLDGARGTAVIREAYRELNQIRNVIAHTNETRPSQRVQHILSTEERLQSELTRLFSILLPAAPR